MDYILIKDTITGKEIEVIQQSTGDFLVVEYDTGETVEVKRRSMGKVMRTWMRARMKDV